MRLGSYAFGRRQLLGARQTRPVARGPVTQSTGMPSNVAIGEALNAVTSATEIAKLIAASDQSLEHVELKLKLADIISALADAKLQIAGFRDLLQARDE